MTSEINPGEVLSRLLRSWWVIVLCMLLFGAAGYLVHTLQPPIYEATATYNVWLDFNDLTTDREFTEYDEDLSINAVGNAYVSPVVLEKVIAEALKQDWIQAENELILNYKLERKHENWELRYLSTDPQLAMDVVNFWAASGYAHLNQLEQAQAIPAYVYFSEPTRAVLPAAPVRYGRNNLILAGMLVGMVGGIFLSGWIVRKKK